MAFSPVTGIMPISTCAGGSTFDLWADDVPLRAARIVDGEVWVAVMPAARDEATHEDATA
jgi:hypothetical protein